MPLRQGGVVRLEIAESRPAFLKEALLGLGASPTRDELYKALGLVSTPAPDDVLTVTRTWQTHITRSRCRAY